MMRGRLSWPVILANPELVAEVLGRLNCTWFSRLKNSQRYWSFSFSRRGHSLMTDASMLFGPSPRRLAKRDGNWRTFQESCPREFVLKRAASNAASMFRGCRFKLPP